MPEYSPIPPYTEIDWASIPAPVECGEELVDLGEIVPEITYDASYAKMGRPGAFTRCYVRRTVAEMLRKAVQALPDGYSLMVYDALRPLSVQRHLYEEIKVKLEKEHPELNEEALLELVDQFVAFPRTNPARPAPHTTGGAVDLTLCKEGIPLDMGTEFDDNTSRAYTRWLEEHEENNVARDNRRLLFSVMTGAGFYSYDCEWWHYAYGERLWAGNVGGTPKYGFHPLCKEENT